MLFPCVIVILLFLTLSNMHKKIAFKKKKNNKKYNSDSRNI